jgi:hypothetical protein
VSYRFDHLINQDIINHASRSGVTLENVQNSGWGQL